MRARTSGAKLSSPPAMRAPCTAKRSSDAALWAWLREPARAVKTLLDKKKIPPLKRTLHFLWVPEHFGTVAWLIKHPEVSERAIAALNLDMVGENLVKTNSRLNIARTPDSLPSFLNNLVENVAEQVEEANLVSPNGSHNLVHWRMTPYSAGSDRHPAPVRTGNGYSGGPEA